MHLKVIVYISNSIHYVYTFHDYIVEAVKLV